MLDITRTLKKKRDNGDYSTGNDTTKIRGGRGVISFRNGIIFAVLFLFLSIFVMPAMAGVPLPFAGDGTEGDPFQISSAENLTTLAGLTNANPQTKINTGTLMGLEYSKANYTQMNDLDLSGVTTWKPIGVSDTSKFFGKFNGNGSVIDKLTYDDSNGIYVGLFGWTDGATLTNITLTNVNIIAREYAGGLAGGLAGIINNCSASGVVTATHNEVGGLVGLMYGGTITNSSANCTVSGNGPEHGIGGLVGTVDGGTQTLSNVFATGAVNGISSEDDPYYVGGLVGNAGGANIINAYAAGTVSCNSHHANVGGLVGWISSVGNISNSTALNEKVIGSGDNVGRIVGKIMGGVTLTSNYAWWAIAKDNAGTKFTDNIGADQKNGANLYKKDNFYLADVDFENSFFNAKLAWTSDNWTKSNDVTSTYYLPIIVNTIAPDFDTSYLGNTPDPNTEFAGDGTEASPFQISLAANLTRLAELTNDKIEIDSGELKGLEYSKANYTLMNTLSLKDTNWIPIGKSTDLSFSGNFDGNGSIIKDLKNESSVDSVGLFGWTKYATLKNVTLTNLSIDAKEYAGGLVGNSFETTINNCSASGVVKGLSNLGGLVGEQTGGSISNSFANCTVSGNSANGGVGGLVGLTIYSVNGLTISNVFASGNVSGDAKFVGGLIGNAVCAKISNAYSVGNVTSTYSNADGGVGGLVGMLDKDSSISNSVAINQKISGDNVGRIVGQLQNGATLSNNYAWWYMTNGAGDKFTVDIITRGKNGTNLYREDKFYCPTDFKSSLYTKLGWNETNWQKGVDNYGLPTIKNTIATGFDTSYIGGQDDENYFLGEGTENSKFEILDEVYLMRLSTLTTGAKTIQSGGMACELYSKANYTLINDINLEGVEWTPIGKEGAGINFTGNFDGNGHEIQKLTYSNENVDYVGLFGYTNGAKLTNIKLTDVNINAKYCVGGLVGESFKTIIYNCSTSGVVNGSEKIGGLVGYSSDETIINNCSTSGVVTGIDILGGLIGNIGISVTVTNSSADCKVSSTGGNSDNGGIGGLVGFSGGSGTIISHVFATGDVTGTGIAPLGGLVGDAYYANISNAYATGTVSCKNDVLEGVGGLVGYAEIGTTISNAYALGNVFGSKSLYTGGLVGYLYHGNISNSIALNQKVIGSSIGNVSRIAGNNYGGKFKNNYAWDGMTNTVGSKFTPDNSTNGADVESKEIWLSSSSDSIAGTIYATKLNWIPSEWMGTQKEKYRLPVITGRSAPSFDASYLKYVEPTPTPTPTSKPKPSGGGGGNSNTGVGVAQKLSSGQSTTFTMEKGAVTEVVLTNGENEVGKVMVTVKSQENKPNNVNSLPDSHIPYEYEEITMYYTTPDEFSDIELTFKVDTAWFKENGLLPTDVVLSHYNEVTGEWENIGCVFTIDAKGNYIYTASVPSFSWFAIAGIKGSQMSTAADGVVLPSGDGDLGNDGSSTNTNPAAQTAVPTKESPLCLLTAILGIMLCAVILWKKE